MNSRIILLKPTSFFESGSRDGLSKNGTGIGAYSTIDSLNNLDYSIRKQRTSHYDRSTIYLLSRYGYSPSSRHVDQLFSSFKLNFSLIANNSQCLWVRFVQPFSGQSDMVEFVALFQNNFFLVDIKLHIQLRESSLNSFIIATQFPHFPLLAKREYIERMKSIKRYFAE